MPNWTFCYLTVTAPSRKPRKGDEGKSPDRFGRVSDLQEFLDAVKTPEGKSTRVQGEDTLPFDFEQIIPTPEELYNAEKVYYSDPEMKKKQEAEEARLTAMHGYGSAYDFHCGEWDTKWNACDCELLADDNGHIESTKTTQAVVFRFQTAWSPPMKVILKVSEMWPKFRFSLDCEEEAQMFPNFVAKFKAGVETSYTERQPEEDEDDCDE